MLLPDLFSAISQLVLLLHGVFIDGNAEPEISILVMALGDLALLAMLQWPRSRRRKRWVLRETIGRVRDQRRLDGT